MQYYFNVKLGGKICHVKAPQQKKSKSKLHNMCIFLVYGLKHISMMPF